MFQWLDVPAVDLTMTLPSIDRLGTGYGLTKTDMEAYIAAYLRDHDRKDPYASPLYAAELGGLPPALDAKAEYDPLTDEGHAYVDTLRQADVAVEHHHLPALVHSYFAFPHLLPLPQHYPQPPS